MTSLGINARLSKKINRELVLKIIYNHKPISRSDIAKITVITPASITKIINKFMKNGLVYESDRVRTSHGRKPVLIDIKTSGLYIIGIYIARKSLSGIIADLNAEIKEKIIIEDFSLGDLNVVNKTIDLIQKLLKSFRVSTNKILGIGMAVPGPINAKRGEIINVELGEPIPYNWDRIFLKESIFKKLKIPVMTDNCANVSAMGESWFGNGTDFSNFVMISFGEGISGGLI